MNLQKQRIYDLRNYNLKKLTDMDYLYKKLLLPFTRLSNKWIIVLSYPLLPRPTMLLNALNAELFKVSKLNF